jgi:hypothetical protein
VVFGICLLVAIYILWVLLVKGALWKIIVGIAGWFGMFIALRLYFPGAVHECLNFSGYSFSWSEVIPTVVVLLAMAYTKEE